MYGHDGKIVISFAGTTDCGSERRMRRSGFRWVA